MTILVTGARGMIGSRLVTALLAKGYSVIGLDRGADTRTAVGYRHIEADLGDADAIRALFVENAIDRVIHLAALAHSKNGEKLTWEHCYHMNVECARNIFKAAGERPLLFVSTVDVFGFSSGTVGPETEPRPVSAYGKSKAMAERECAELCANYSIFRFSPVYTGEIKRDIQKRYYLKYPSIAYRIDGGTEYEVLDVDNAVAAMSDWCAEEPKGEIRIIKDPERMKTADCIARERAEGRAALVLHFHSRPLSVALKLALRLTGENKYTYLLNKALNPLRSE